MAVHHHLDAILAELSETLDRVDGNELAALASLVARSPRVFVTGAGRSGLVMRGFAMRLMHLGCNVHVVGETTAPAITGGDLLLVGSGSGATASVLGHAQHAAAGGAGIALITIRRDSPIGRLAAEVLTIPAPTPKLDQDGALHSTQPMGTLFEQSLGLVLDALVLLLMEALEQDQHTMFTRHANLE